MHLDLYRALGKIAVDAAVLLVGGGVVDPVGFLWIAEDGMVHHEDEAAAGFEHAPAFSEYFLHVLDVLDSEHYRYDLEGFALSEAELVRRRSMKFDLR